MAATTVTRWNGQMQFTATTGSGHEIVLDAADAVGGQDKGPRPKELLLVALTGCTGMDVVSILKKMRAPYDRFEVAAEADASEEHPKVYTNIRVVYRLWGAEESLEKLKKAADLSWTRYCGVTNMLNKAAEVTYRIEFNGENVQDVRPASVQG